MPAGYHGSTLLHAAGCNSLGPKLALVS